MIKKDYVVYEVYYCGLLAYIGSGNRQRPHHVKSGTSHNKALNELFVRASVYGEPNVKVEVVKEFKTKEEATKSEKFWIKRKTPLFNGTFCNSGSAKILTDEERNTLLSVDNDLLHRIKKIESIAEDVGVNANLIFTPYGFRMPVKDIRWDSQNFDVISLSLLGSCKSLEGFCDAYIDHNDNVVIKAKSESIERINSALGFVKFVDYFNNRKSKNKPTAYREDHDPNYNGGVVPRACYDYIDNTCLLFRSLGERRKVKIIVALKTPERNQYEVVCLNNNQVLFSTDDSSLAIDVYRNIFLRGYEFLYENSWDVDADATLILNGCFDFEKGIVFNDIKLDTVMKPLLKFDNYIFNYDEDVVSWLSNKGISHKIPSNKNAKFLFITEKGKFGVSNVKLSAFKQGGNIEDFYCTYKENLDKAISHLLLNN